jgi:protein-disulfide isomerase
MAFARVMKVLDVVATALVIIAATLFLKTYVDDRWIHPRVAANTLKPVEDVKGLTIPAGMARHASGRGSVALVEFTDFQCPYCARHARDTAPALEKEFVDTGAIRHVVFNFPLEAMHPDAHRAAAAAECAARQGRYWDMHGRLFGDPKALAIDGLRRTAVTIGLRLDDFNHCVDAQSADAIAADLAEGKRLGVVSTPTFFVGLMQQDESIALYKRINGALPLSEFRNAIEVVSARARTAARQGE